MRAEEAKPGELASGGTRPFRSVSEDKGEGGLTERRNAHCSRNWDELRPKGSPWPKTERESEEHNTV